jgi:hypothetical protein
MRPEQQSMSDEQVEKTIINLAKLNASAKVTKKT